MQRLKISFYHHLKFSGIILTLVLLYSCAGSPDENREYGWIPFTVLDLDTAENAVDMSFLNSEAAGESGFITVKDGHFIDGKGQRIRFFGDNLTFGGCFPERDVATQIAAALQKKGMNVVRFHHMDNQSAPGGIWSESMDDLDPDQLDKLDWLIYQLKLHGIYSNINTHVSFTYPGVNYEDIEQFNYGKGIDNFYRPYIEMQKKYAKKLLLHKNAYTGNTYANEPAVAFVEVNNENSLLSNWALLPKLNRDHKMALIGQWNAWLDSHSVYNSVNGKDLMEIIQNYENKDTDSQIRMIWHFLMDTEMAYAKEMTDYYRNDLKIHALIAESQASYSGVEGILRESSYSDYIDMHSYWEHPRFPGRSWSRSNWLIRNSSMVSDHGGGTVLGFGEHRVKGKPLTISEYDHPAPSFFCAEMYPMLNAVAAFQDFDGIYHFTFNGPYDQGKIQGFFSSAGHPLKQIFIPVGAVLFRMGAVSPGEHPVQLDLPPAAVLDELVEFGNRLRLHGSNMRGVWEKAGANSSLIIAHPMEVNMGGKELKLSEPVENPTDGWISDNGEILWDNRDSTEAIFTVNAPAARIAAGYIGGKQIELGDVTIAMDSTTFNWATISLTSLDRKSIEESSKILLIAAGRVENTDMGWNDDKTSVGTDWGSTPTRAEGIPARIIFSNMKPFSVNALDSAGNVGTKIRPVKQGNRRVLNIGAQYQTLWYLLTRE